MEDNDSDDSAISAERSWTAFGKQIRTRANSVSAPQAYSGDNYFVRKANSTGPTQTPQR